MVSAQQYPLPSCAYFRFPKCVQQGGGYRWPLLALRRLFVFTLSLLKLSASVFLSFFINLSPSFILLSLIHPRLSSIRLCLLCPQSIGRCLGVSCLYSICLCLCLYSISLLLYLFFLYSVFDFVSFVATIFLFAFVSFFSNLSLFLSVPLTRRDMTPSIFTGLCTASAKRLRAGEKERGPHWGRCLCCRQSIRICLCILPLIYPSLSPSSPIHVLVFVYLVCICPWLRVFSLYTICLCFVSFVSNLSLIHHFVCLSHPQDEARPR